MDKHDMLERRNRHLDALNSRADLIWFGQNTSPFEPCPAVREATIDCIEGGKHRRYAPPLGIETFRWAILADLGLDRGFAVMVADGAIEGLYHVCHTLLGPDDEFFETEPGWLWPPHFATSGRARVIGLPIHEPDAGFRLRPARLRDAVTVPTRLIYPVDPNNPLASIQTPEWIAEIAAIARDAGAFLIHDCTHRHFAEAHTLAALRYPEKTITTYSHSKCLGLAGLMLGALAAPPRGH